VLVSALGFSSSFTKFVVVFHLYLLPEKKNWLFATAGPNFYKANRDFDHL
jgi:hypothetical protein